MDEARARAQEGAPYLTTVWAETQTAGRGRQGRTWQSAAGYGLYFTVIAHITLESEHFGLIPLLVGAVLCLSVRDLTGVQASLKWPNDLLAPDGRKLAGILVERDAKSASFLIGIGLNVRVQPFDLPNKNLSAAASLEEFCADQSNSGVDRVALLLEVLSRLGNELLEVTPEHTLELWQSQQNMLGQTVRITHMDGSGFTGIALELGRTGTLRVQTETEIREVSSGEVSLRFT
jgi:BirA family transcriptional regulator, biotin operon repressor / biotin---[acetyl-CoA-carboxylase] ligase